MAVAPADAIHGAVCRGSLFDRVMSYPKPIAALTSAVM